MKLFVRMNIYPYICKIKLKDMRKLICKSTDNYQYEAESLDFYCNDNLVFSQLNRKLNRGGKSLYLYDWSVKEEVVSAGSFSRGEKWWRKMSSKLKELNYEISWEDIREAIKNREKENIKERLSDVIFIQTQHNKELEKTEKRLVFLRKQIKANKSIIKSLQNQDICTEG